MRLFKLLPVVLLASPVFAAPYGQPVQQGGQNAQRWTSLKMGDVEYSAGATLRRDETELGSGTKARTTTLGLSGRYGYFLDSQNQVLTGLDYFYSKSKSGGLDSSDRTYGVGAGYRFNFIPQGNLVPFAGAFVSYGESRFRNGFSNSDEEQVNLDTSIGVRYFVTPSISANTELFYAQNLNNRDTQKDSSFGARFGFSLFDR